MQLTRKKHIIKYCRIYILAPHWQILNNKIVFDFIWFFLLFNLTHNNYMLIIVRYVQNFYSTNQSLFLLKQRALQSYITVK